MTDPAALSEERIAQIERARERVAAAEYQQSTWAQNYADDVPVLLAAYDEMSNRVFVAECEAARLRAASQAPGVRVPVEPTKAMIAAAVGRKPLNLDAPEIERAKRIWAAMLAAANHPAGGA